MEAPCYCDAYEAEMQKIYETPMPWIGMYVAAASLVCAIAMAGDVINGISHKRLWFPCKFFTMNAASITVLAVAMKVPVDFTTLMWGDTDTMTKISSTVFMTTVMGNFITSFALMDDNAILMNIVALGILVITIIVNMCIQLKNWGIWGFRFTHIYVLVSMFVLFVTLSSSVLIVPTTKRYIEVKYNELHKTSCDGRKLEEIGNLTNQKLKEVVGKYWIMAKTGSPQFVMARSVISSTSGAICLFTALLLVRDAIRMNIKWPGDGNSNASSYQWSTSWILWIQLVGVVVGTVAPVCRWLTAICFNCRNLITENHQNEFKLVETYWIQRLVEWKEKPLVAQIHSMKCKKFIHGLKNFILNLCICLQFGIVVTSKLVQLISIIFILPVFSCFYYCNKGFKGDRISKSSASANHESSEPGNSSPQLDLSNYVLLLEGEANLPKSILTNMCHELHKVIQIGKIHQPKNVTKLLRISNSSFKWVADFDSTNQVLNSWILPVVTLTSIAIALPNTENHRLEQLIRSVSEGLLYANLVEESICSKGENLLNIKHAAEVAWVGIELYRKWLDKDFRELSLKGKTSKEILETLVDIAEKTEIEFQRSITGSSKVLVANSMYRISQTILKDYESSTDDHKDENLFERLSIMIADILAACLTNLPRVIAYKCYCSTIEERENSVRHAVRLLGETEEILEILQHHQLLSLSVDRAVYIDEWHGFMKQKNPPPVVGLSNNELAASVSGELHLAVNE